MQYELKDPFDYAYQGETQKASFVTLIAPSVKQLQHFTPIKQAFSAAINEIASTNESSAASGDAKTGATEVLQLMHVWTGDLSKVYLHAQQLFKAGVALIDGETTFTTPLLEKMSVTDFEGLVGEYIANFIVPSLIGE